MILSNNSLELFHEIVGLLMDIQKEEDHIKLFFSINKEIDISADAIKKEELKTLVGKRIGVFNNDGNYKIRKIVNKNKK